MFGLRRSEKIAPLSSTPEEPQEDEKATIASPKSNTVSSTPSSTPSVTPINSSRLRFRLYTDSDEIRDDIKTFQKTIRKYIFSYLQTAEDHLKFTYPSFFKKTSPTNRSSSFNTIDDVYNQLRWIKNAKAKLIKSHFLSCSKITYPKEVTDYYDLLSKIDIENDSSAKIREDLVTIIKGLDQKLAPPKDAKDEIYQLPSTFEI